MPASAVRRSDRIWGSSLGAAPGPWSPPLPRPLYRAPRPLAPQGRAGYDPPPLARFESSRRGSERQRRKTDVQRTLSHSRAEERARPGLRAGELGARGAEGRARENAPQSRGSSLHHRRPGDLHRRPGRDEAAPRPPPVTRALPPRQRPRGGAGDRRRQPGEDRLERDAVVLPGHGPAQGRGAARRQVPADDQRRDHAQHEQDLPSGRDRRRLRADRLLALQPLLHDTGLRRPADLHPGSPQLHGAPAAGRIRLRDLPLQLRLDRGQPAHRPGTDGKRGGLEAVFGGGAARLLHHAGR